MLNNHLKKEGNRSVTKCKRLKMQAEYGMQRFTDAAGKIFLKCIGRLRTNG